MLHTPCPSLSCSTRRPAVLTPRFVFFPLNAHFRCLSALLVCSCVDLVARVWSLLVAVFTLLPVYVFWFVAVTSLWSAYGSCWSLRPTRGLGAPLVRHSNHPTTERPCIHLLFIFPTTQVSFLGLWRYLIPMVSRPMSTFNNDSTNAKTLTWTSNILIHLHNTLHTHSSLSSFF